MTAPASRCAHFTPSGFAVSKTCPAGVRFRDVARAGKLPCLTLADQEDRSGGCASFRPVPREQLDAEQRAIDEAVARFDEGRCPQCGAALAKAENAEGIIWTCPTHGGIGRGCKRASL